MIYTLGILKILPFKDLNQIWNTVKYTFHQQPGSDQNPSKALHVNLSRVNPFFSHRSIQAHIWTCEAEMFPAQFTGQIVCNIVSAASCAFMVECFWLWYSRSGWCACQATWSGHWQELVDKMRWKGKREWEEEGKRIKRREREVTEVSWRQRKRRGEASKNSSYHILVWLWGGKALCSCLVLKIRSRAMTSGVDIQATTSACLLMRDIQTFSSVISLKKVNFLFF